MYFSQTFRINHSACMAILVPAHDSEAMHSRLTDLHTLTLSPPPHYSSVSTGSDVTIPCSGSFSSLAHPHPTWCGSLSYGLHSRLRSAWHFPLSVAWGFQKPFLVPGLKDSRMSELGCRASHPTPLMNTAGHQRRTDTAACPLARPRPLATPRPRHHS